MIRIGFLIVLTLTRLTSNSQSICNREVYGTKKYIEKLPVNICIPDGFVIDDYVRISDLNDDEKMDFLAVKYNRKEDYQIDGDITYWNFYLQNPKDTLYQLIRTLTNITPPYIKNISLDYVTTHPVAEEIFKSYPRRISHKSSFTVSKDTVRLSYKFEDTYGKSFVFVYRRDRRDWYLENVEYFIGELPEYWWQDNDFYYPLNDKLKVIEKKKPKQSIAIGQLDLKHAFKYGQIEWLHLSEQHVDRIDEHLWPSVLKVKFEKCNGMVLPDDWTY